MSHIRSENDLPLVEGKPLTTGDDMRSESDGRARTNIYAVWRTLLARIPSEIHLTSCDGIEVECNVAGIHSNE
jgi:hypothetical protein